MEANVIDIDSLNVISNPVIVAVATWFVAKAYYGHQVRRLMARLEVAEERAGTPPNPAIWTR